MKTDLDQLLASLPAEGVLRATRLGLALVPQLRNEDWRQIVARVTALARMATGARQTLTAWLGDALVYGGVQGRGLIMECAEASGFESGTIRNAKMVCSRIPVSCRHDALSWTHHCEVALVLSDREEIERWLSLAERENLSTSALRRRVRLRMSSGYGASSAGLATSSISAFRLMRELRAVARSIAREKEAWQRWPSNAAQLALEELRPITDFVDAVRLRALSEVGQTPRDPTRN